MKKLSKILKIFLTLGIIVSAVVAVASIIFRMQKKLQEISDDQCDGAEDNETACSGSCEECGMCDSEEDLVFDMDGNDESEDEESDE